MTADFADVLGLSDKDLQDWLPYYIDTEDWDVDEKARRPSQAAYNKLQGKADRQAAKLAGRVSRGTITPDVWADLFIDTLQERHSDAAALGRQRAGIAGARNGDDEDLGAAVATDEWRFLQSFRDDIKNGRYDSEDGTLNADAIATRASWYTKKLLATANEAFVQSSSEKATFLWILGETVEEHCTQCPDLAKGGPYSRDNIPTYPRQGNTKCLFNCACHLKRKDGISSFTPPGE